MPHWLRYPPMRLRRANLSPGSSLALPVIFRVQMMRCVATKLPSRRGANSSRRWRTWKPKFRLLFETGKYCPSHIYLLFNPVHFSLSFSITRLLRASKNEKPPKDKNISHRNNIMAHRASSLSSLSLSLSHSLDPHPHTSTPFLPASHKLATAQAELQACESHLSKKEKELQVARTIALRDGLSIRCNALMECGMAWVDAGKDALHATESLLIDSGPYKNLMWPLYQFLFCAKNAS